jgi:hypothetical protein
MTDAASYIFQRQLLWAQRKASRSAAAQVTEADSRTRALNDNLFRTTRQARSMHEEIARPGKLVVFTTPKRFW